MCIRLHGTITQTTCHRQNLICQHRRKTKAVPLNATVELVGRGGIAPTHSHLGNLLDGGEWSASRPGLAFVPGERTAGTHCTGSWVGPRAGLDTEDRGKILLPMPGIEPRSPGSPARSQTLYLLRYPAQKEILCYNALNVSSKYV
jgi:hypothetical protein